MFELVWVSGALLVMAIAFRVCSAGVKTSEQRAQTEMLKAEAVIVTYEAVGRRKTPRHGLGYHAPVRQYVLQDRSTESRKTAQPAVNRHRFPFIPVPPIVSIVIDGNTVECAANSRKLRSNTYPAGTKLNVLYRKKVFPLVGVAYDIRVDEEGHRPVSAETLAVLFKVISAIIFLVAVAIAIIWISNN